MWSTFLMLVADCSAASYQTIRCLTLRPVRGVSRAAAYSLPIAPSKPATISQLQHKACNAAERLMGQLPRVSIYKPKSRPGVKLALLTLSFIIRICRSLVSSEE